MKNFHKLLLTSALTVAPLAASAQTANISTTTLSTAGVDVTTTPQNASGNTYFANDGSTFILIKNGNGTPVTATLITQQTAIQAQGYGTIPLADVTVGVPSATTLLIGPFPTSRWNTTQGTVRVSMSTVTNVSATSIKVPR